MNILKDLHLQSNNSGVSTGVKSFPGKGPVLESHSPVDGKLIGKVTSATREEYDQVIQTAQQAFHAWKLWPAPKRGDVVRQMGDALRMQKDQLGKLVSY